MSKPKTRPAPELSPVGPYPFAEDVVTRAAEAIARARCPGREGPFGGYDYGHNTSLYGPEPEDGRYVIRDFRDPSSPTWGRWVHQEHDRDAHEAMYDKLTGEHIAVAALSASGLIALPSATDLARALWIADGCDPEIWDEQRGRQWRAYMVRKRPEYLKKAELLLMLLRPSPTT